MLQEAESVDTETLSVNHSFLLLEPGVSAGLVTYHAVFYLQGTRHGHYKMTSSAVQ